MGTPTQISRLAVTAFIAGLLAAANGLLAILSRSDLFLLGVLISGAAAFLLGVCGWLRIGRASGKLTGKAFAGWGMGIPLIGFGLGFVLLPNV